MHRITPRPRTTVKRPLAYEGRRANAMVRIDFRDFVELAGFRHPRMALEIAMSDGLVEPCTVKNFRYGLGLIVAMLE